MESIPESLFTDENLQKLHDELTQLILNNNKDFLSVDELANYLDISKSAIYKITSKREIPFYNPGGKKIYFKKNEINCWIESSRVTPDREIHEKFNESTMNSKNKGLW